MTRFTRLLVIPPILMTSCLGCLDQPASQDGRTSSRPVSNGIPRPSEGAQSAETLAADREFELLLAGKSEDGNRTAEARQWLDPKNSNNVLWKIDRNETLQMVDELYQSGATRVYAIYSPAKESIRVNLCASLLVVLPKDQAARKKVLSVYNKVYKRIWGNDHEREIDRGQKYLYLNMDP